MVPQAPLAIPAPDLRPQPPQPASIDEATLKQKSRAFYEAMDAGDAVTFEALVGPSFVLFDQARSYTREYLSGRLRGRAERNEPRRSRGWKEERIYVGPNAGVFVGSAIESVPAFGDRKSAEWDGWHTLVWVHDGSDWKVAHAQWQPGGIEAERAMWNEAYRRSSGFKEAANQLLIDTVKGRKPGTALDVAMGQGRNALHLAANGWRVTGVDISDEGLRLARQAATKAKLKLEAIQADITTYEFGRDKWDLVTLIYAGDEVPQIIRLKASVKRGGLFVIEYFHDEGSAGAGIGGFKTGELAGLFADWKVLRDEVVEDVADWGLRRAKLVRFVAQRP